MSRSVWRRLCHRVGRRGIFLLFLAFLDLASAARLIWPDPQTTTSVSYQYLASIVPLVAWAGLWALVAVVCAVYAFLPQDAVAFGMAAFLKFLWALVYLVGWLAVGVPQGYFSVALWAFAGLVVLVISTWPEVPYVAEEGDR
jgi:hypothetical protein